MTTELVATIIEAVGRITFALAIAFIGWLLLAQKPTCPACGNPLDLPQTYTQAKSEMVKPMIQPTGALFGRASWGLCKCQ